MADKIDMSLDDIIKLKNKRGSRSRGRGQRGGRGGFTRGGGRGGQSRGRAKWIDKKSSPATQRGRGRGSARSRGGSRGKPRGGSRGALRRPTSASPKGVSPLNRKASDTSQKTNFKKTAPQRARGRGRTVPGSRFTDGEPSLRGSRGGGRFRIQRGSIGQRGGRGGRGGRGAIQQVQKQAINALRKAKTTLSKINAQVRRQNFVNVKRGIPVNRAEQRTPGSFQRSSIRSSWSGRSRGRGRSFQNKFIPSKLNRSTSNSLLSLKSLSSQKTVRQFGSTTSLNTQTRGRKRAWRDNSIQRETPKIMTISVSNSTRGQNNRSSNMRPHIGTQNINFSSGIFAQGSTGVSLNDRFTSSEGSGGSSVIFDSRERKVFF